jgi:predicted nucleic acid-binding protein
MGSLNALIGDRVYLDANIFIYALEDFSAVGTKLRALFAQFDRGELQAVTSELTLAEILVKPLRDGDVAACESYRRVIQTSASLEVVPIGRDILLAAATLRATTTMKLPDAIHAATATSARCATLLTNDRGFAGLVGIAILPLVSLP